MCSYLLLTYFMSYLKTDLTTEGAMYWDDAEVGHLEKPLVDGSVVNSFLICYLLIS